MSWCWRAEIPLAALSLLACSARQGVGQVVRREAEVRVLGIASRPLFGGAGGGVAWRDARRTRIAVTVAGGWLEGGRPAARADLAYHFLLDPRRRSGSAVYGGAGLSVQAGGGGVRPYALLVLGAENAPGGRGGAFAEIGIGGGVRATAGYRWRRHVAPGR